VGYEAATLRKSLGILVAVAGAVFMATWGSTSHGRSSSSVGIILLGHVLFAFNCLGTSIYVIVTKDLLRKYPSLSVTGWCYLPASLMMFLTVCIVNSVPELLSFVCTDDNPAVQQSCISGSWRVPGSMVLPLCYWIVFPTILSYFFMTWANQFAVASVVSAYTVLQPFTCVAISAALIALNGTSWAEGYGLKAPGAELLGLAGIILGLGLLFTDRSLAVQATSSCHNGQKEPSATLTTGSPSPRRPPDGSRLLEGG